MHQFPMPQGQGELQTVTEGGCVTSLLQFLDLQQVILNILQL